MQNNKPEYSFLLPNVTTKTVNLVLTPELFYLLHNYTCTETIQMLQMTKRKELKVRRMRKEWGSSGVLFVPVLWPALPELLPYWWLLHRRLDPMAERSGCRRKETGRSSHCTRCWSRRTCCSLCNLSHTHTRTLAKCLKQSINVYREQSVQRLGSVACTDIVCVRVCVYACIFTRGVLFRGIWCQRWEQSFGFKLLLWHMLGSVVSWRAVLPLL